MPRPWLASLCAVVALAGCGNDPVQADLILSAERVFDGRELIEDGAVALRGNEVVAVGAADELDVEAARRLALGDATILPGLVDLHVHGLGEGQRFSPVTTVRDVGTPEAALAGLRPDPSGPRVIFAGPLLTVPGGYPIPVHGAEVAGVVRDVAEARAAVRRLAERGAGVIKVSIEWGRTGLPVLSRGQLEAIVAEAHARDLRVTAHVGVARGARLALETGVDELAHMPCPGGDPGLMDDLVEAGIEIVGTLHVISGFERCPTGVLDAARAFVAAGGTLLYGSDYGNPNVPLGLDVEELRLMVRAGLSPLEALTNATARAGEQLGIRGLGTLRQGAPADVVAVDGNPLTDLDDLTVPKVLIVRGRIVIANGRIASTG